MENVKKCLCGKMPVVKTECNGRITIKCTCGFFMPMCPTMADAVKGWNSFIDKNNSPDEIKRIYGYEDSTPKKTKTSNKKPKKHKKEVIADKEEEIKEENY